MVYFWGDKGSFTLPQRGIVRLERGHHVDCRRRRRRLRLLPHRMDTFTTRHQRSWWRLPAIGPCRYVWPVVWCVRSLCGMLEPLRRAFRWVLPVHRARHAAVCGSWDHLFLGSRGSPIRGQRPACSDLLVRHASAHKADVHQNLFVRTPGRDQLVDGSQKLIVGLARRGRGQRRPRCASGHARAVGRHRLVVCPRQRARQACQQDFAWKSLSIRKQDFACALPSPTPPSRVWATHETAWL